MYIVAEFQTTGDTTSILTFQFTDKNEAEQKYHQVLSYAAVSSVNIHAVSMMNEFGCVAKNEFYTHEPAPEPLVEQDEQ